MPPHTAPHTLPPTHGRRLPLTARAIIVAPLVPPAHPPVFLPSCAQLPCRRPLVARPVPTRANHRPASLSTSAHAAAHRTPAHAHRMHIHRTAAARRTDRRGAPLPAASCSRPVLTARRSRCPALSSALLQRKNHPRPGGRGHKETLRKDEPMPRDRERKKLYAHGRSICIEFSFVFLYSAPAGRTAVTAGGKLGRLGGSSNKHFGRCHPGKTAKHADVCNAFRSL